MREPSIAQGLPRAAKASKIVKFKVTCANVALSAGRVQTSSLRLTESAHAEEVVRFGLQRDCISGSHGRHTCT